MARVRAGTAGLRASIGALAGLRAGRAEMRHLESAGARRESNRAYGCGGRRLMFAPKAGAFWADAEWLRRLPARRPSAPRAALNGRRPSRCCHDPWRSSGVDLRFARHLYFETTRRGCQTQPRFLADGVPAVPPWVPGPELPLLSSRPWLLDPGSAGIGVWSRGSRRHGVWSGKIDAPPTGLDPGIGQGPCSRPCGRFPARGRGRQVAPLRAVGRVMHGRASGKRPRAAHRLR